MNTPKRKRKFYGKPLPAKRDVQAHLQFIGLATGKPKFKVTPKKRKK